MTEISRPDFTYQWSSGGAIVAPSNAKIQTGFVAEVPPFQWQNWWQNRTDNGLVHLFQKGISVWSATQDYYYNVSGTRSYVQGSDGAIYVALQNSVNQNPTTATTYWQKAFIDVATLNTALASGGPVIGASRNAFMQITTASATATWTANEIIVGVSLTGARYKLSSFSKPVNLATTGAGGMDTGVAPTSGYVAIYAIYNPTTTTSALLATNATSSAATEVYSGANMPSGYTASALVAVWPTDASKLFKVGFLQDRQVNLVRALVYNTNTGLGSYTAVALTAAIPLNAKILICDLQSFSSTGGANVTFAVGADSVGTGAVSYSTLTPGQGMCRCPILTPQTVYALYTTTAGTPNLQIWAAGYTF